MVYQHKEIRATPGRDGDIERPLPHPRALVEGAKGMRCVVTARESGEGAHYRPMPEWEWIEDHMAFHGTPELQEARELIGPLRAGRQEIAYLAVLE
jgi:hypothetical protein